MGGFRYFRRAPLFAAGVLAGAAGAAGLMAYVDVRDHEAGGWTDWESFIDAAFYRQAYKAVAGPEYCPGYPGYPHRVPCADFVAAEPHEGRLLAWDRDAVTLFVPDHPSLRLVAQSTIASLNAHDLGIPRISITGSRQDADIEIRVVNQFLNRGLPRRLDDSVPGSPPDEDDMAEEPVVEMDYERAHYKKICHGFGCISEMTTHKVPADDLSRFFADFIHKSFDDNRLVYFDDIDTDDRGFYMVSDGFDIDSAYCAFSHYKIRDFEYIMEFIPECILLAMGLKDDILKELDIVSHEFTAAGVYKETNASRIIQNHFKILARCNIPRNKASALKFAITLPEGTGVMCDAFLIGIGVE